MCIFLCLASILAKERKILENRVSALRTTKVVTTSYVPDGEGNKEQNPETVVMCFFFIVNEMYLLLLFEEIIFNQILFFVLDMFTKANLVHVLSHALNF